MSETDNATTASAPLPRCPIASELYCGIGLTTILEVFNESRCPECV